MFLQDLSLRGDHLNLLKKTPFWLIIDAIISRTLDADKCIKSDMVLTKLVAAYNPQTDSFTIAGKNVELTANHVKLIFGISCGTDRFATKLKTREQVAFAKRHNIQQRLTSKAISDMLKELAQENKTNIEDVQDVARLVCMFLIVKLFFPTSGITVSWKHVDAMEDLTKMKSYNWAAEIRDELVESIKKSQHSPKDVKGCQLLLPVSEVIQIYFYNCMTYNTSNTSANQLYICSIGYANTQTFLNKSCQNIKCPDYLSGIYPHLKMRYKPFQTS
ncbi:hypothetical protein RHGRI_024465 [Rhododendron griersonianum]|uniref:DNA-directed RNA polymerase n=1 Tax=Rhododendron griersonianum TaxID=479676 RepID=A0AAV6JCS9_9ERIC|nr:hypothetical protein RHGRI_024465 [Rhododendron griersonianum]